MMKYSSISARSSSDNSRPNAGFTLIELMIALVVGSIAIAIIYSIYIVQQRSFKRETMIVQTQQNARSALTFMERDLRMAGYDRLNTDLFTITDIRLDADQNGTLTFTADMGDGGTADNGSLDGNETFTYALYDDPNTLTGGNMDLGRTVGALLPDLVAVNIEALGFAFAFDADADGRLDFNDDNADGVMNAPPTGNEGIYWAVDSDGDNDLDLELDTNKDGEITATDGTAALPIDVNINRIRAIKVFILARTKGMDLNYSNNEIYKVGRRVVSGGGDQFRRRLLVTTVRCRNLGL